MKVCLYLEYLNFLNGWLYQRIGTGLLSSYKNQRVILEKLGIETSDRWDKTADLLLINTPWLKSLYLIRQARRRGIPVIIWSHVTAEDASAVFRFNRFLFPLIKKYLTYAYSRADIVLCPSAYTRGLLLAYGLPPEKLRVQSNGVKTGAFYRDEAKRVAGRKQYNLKGLVIGTVGLVIPRKGVDTFLKLAQEFPERQFIWFGKIYGRLMVKPLPADRPANTRFTGYVDDILAAFNALDIFIFPSYEENQGMAILEAAAIGLPIIVRDLPVYRGWLEHGVNCLKAKDDSEFVSYLRRLENDRELRLKLNAGALKLAKEESLDTLAEKLDKVFGKLLN